MTPPALPEAFLDAIPLAVGRELAARVWEVWAELTTLHPRDLPPCVAGPVESGYVLGWPLPDRDLQVTVTLDGLSWDYDRGGAWVAFGESLQAPRDGPESLHPFGLCMAEVIAEYRELLKALPPGADLQ